MKFLAILGVALLLSACGERQPEPDRWSNMTAHGCVLESRVDSGQRTYCGKACWKPIFVRTYSCPATKWSFNE
jgi:hypothetical protein